MVAPMRCYAHTVPTFTATSDSSPLHTTFTLRSHGATFTLYPRSPRLLHHSSRGLPIDLVGKLWMFSFLFLSSSGSRTRGAAWRRERRLRVVHRACLGKTEGRSPRLSRLHAEMVGPPRAPGGRRPSAWARRAFAPVLHITVARGACWPVACRELPRVVEYGEWAGACSLLLTPAGCAV